MFLLHCYSTDTINSAIAAPRSTRSWQPIHNPSNTPYLYSRLGATFQVLQSLQLGVRGKLLLNLLSSRSSRMNSTSDIGEDFSQTQTLDVGLVYRQTKMEAKLGLARIYVDDARDVQSGFEILIAQNYGMGQFCVDSIRMRDTYWDLISKKAGLDNEEGEET